MKEDERRGGETFLVPDGDGLDGGGSLSGGGLTGGNKTKVCKKRAAREGH